MSNPFEGNLSGVKDLLERVGLRKPLSRLRHLLDPKLRQQNRAVEADLREFEQQFQFLAKSRTQSSNRKLLVISLSNWLPQLKMESILAKSIEFKGLTPVVVTYSDMDLAHRYHQALGINEFVFLDKFKNREDTKIATQVTEEILQKTPTLRELLDLEFRNVQIGRHVLSTIVSSLRNGSVEFDDPQVVEMLRNGLPEAIQMALAAERLIDEVQPKLCLLLERGYVPYGELFDVALNRGIPVIQYCHSHRTDALICKRYTGETRNDHPWSLASESWANIRSMPWSSETEQDLMREIRGRYEEGTWFNRKYLQVGKTIKSADEVRQQLDLDPDKKTAIIFSHVLWDATFFYGTNLFEDYEQWLVATVKAACKNPNVNWVVKLHPDYVWKMKKAGDTGRPPEYAALEQKVGPLPDHIKILAPQTDISTFSLFDVTDWCVTVRGTIGIEMSCFGVPVVTAGTGRYSELGFTIDSETQEEYFDRIRNIHTTPPMTSEQIELARRHAYAVFRMKPFPFHTFEMVQDDLESLGHALDHNVVIRVNSPEELRQAEDLRVFGEWAAHATEQDLLLNAPTRQAVRAA